MEDFPKIHYSGMGILNKIQQMMGELQCEPENFLTTLYGMQKEMMNYVKIIQRQLKSMLEDSLAVIVLS